MENISIILSFLVLYFSTRFSMSAPKYEYNFKIIFNDSKVDLRDDVCFFLYTRENLNNPEQLWVDDKNSIDKSLYKSSRATKFMTHGWLNSYQGRNCMTVKNAFLSHDDYNVIVVDWANVAKLPYLEAAGLIKAVGAHIAKMIDILASQGSSLSDMSLVGHSLGAHVMGLAGYQASNKIGHVVGLDPAGPGFKSAGPGNGISSSDATMVEIIHTNAGHLGLSEPVGHADFYPNGGGLEQPGCGEDTNHYCAHDRAYIYYAEALTKPNSLLALVDKTEEGKGIVFSAYC
ncbi:pancreatic triacylglycerol lipase-like isoform X2 [Phymastichus coffea]|uniref:pancreatic triacylglycerol lipase-like isoform X2 n=1 Tax=Phymastichus coffea TaxID=108790 RepID=UPI00273C5168|nr:pancreatic triacylglycerol lipase-like isoform X2 [Phymastichus coffea]